MKNGLLIYTGKEQELVNLFFTPDSVTVRTFYKIQNPKDLASRGKNAPNRGENPNISEEEKKKKEQEEIIQYKKAKLSALSQSVLTKDVKNLTGKFVTVNKELLMVARQKTYRLDKACWVPYNEVCMSLKRKNIDTSSSDGISFFDRNAMTINGHENFAQFHKKFRASQGYIPIRWFVLPGTTLLTAPVIANPAQKILSNRDFGEKIVLKEEVLSKEKLNEVNKKIEGFRSYWLPTLKIEGPDTIKANGTVELTVRAFHQGGKVCPDIHEYYVQPVSGYAPNSRVILHKGVGTFRIMALGLMPGETLRVKVNDQYWSGKAEKTLQVI